MKYIALILTFVCGIAQGATIDLATQVRGILPPALGGEVTFKHYSATGDGSTDDTTAINNALASSYTKIRCTSGTYIVTALTISSKKEINLDSGCIIKEKNSGNGNILTISATADGTVIRGGEIDGNRSNQTTGGWGIKTLADDTVIDGVYIHDTYTMAIQVYAADRVRILNNRLVDANSYGIYAVAGTRESYDLIISNNYINSESIDSSGNQGIMVLGGFYDVDGTATSGGLGYISGTTMTITQAPSSGAYTVGHYVSAGFTQTPALQITALGTGTGGTGTYTVNVSTTYGSAGTPVAINTGNPATHGWHGVTITNNDVRKQVATGGANAEGIDAVRNVEDVVISGNHVTGGSNSISTGASLFSAHYAKNIVIDGNTLSNSDNYCIEANRDTRVAITNNICIAATGTPTPMGIFVGEDPIPQSGATSEAVVSDNIIYGYTTAIKLFGQHQQKGITVTGNKVYGAASGTTYGLYIDDSDDFIGQGNVFENLNTGVYFTDSSLTHTLDNILITDNVFDTVTTRFTKSFAGSSTFGNDVLIDGVTPSTGAEWAENTTYTWDATNNTMKAALVAEVLTANRTYYIRSDGSDSNTGLTNTAGGAFLTVQHCFDVVAGLDSGASGYNVICQLPASTTFTEALTAQSMRGAGTVTLKGGANLAAAVGYKITQSSGAVFTNSQAQTRYVISGVEINGTGTATTGIAGSNPSVTQVLNTVFSGGFSTADMYAYNMATVQTTGAIEVNASAGTHARHVYANYKGSIVHAQAVTLTGTPNFTTAYVQVLNNGTALLTGSTTSGAATGAFCWVSSNGNLQTGGMTLPGTTTTCTPTLGGIYDSASTTWSVSQGGTGRTTGTTAYSLVATGTTATGAQQTLANGASGEVLIGGGASALPSWTASPTLTTLTTTGNIELGHASDTTLARASAGKVTIEGNTIPVVANTVFASLPSAASATTYSQQYIVTDYLGGPTLVYSNGTNWIPVTNNQARYIDDTDVSTAATTETFIRSWTIPANFLKVGDSFTIGIYFSKSSNSAAQTFYVHNGTVGGDCTSDTNLNFSVAASISSANVRGSYTLLSFTVASTTSIDLVAAPGSSTITTTTHTISNIANASYFDFCMKNDAGGTTFKYLGYWITHGRN